MEFLDICLLSCLCVCDLKTLKTICDLKTLTLVRTFELQGIEAYNILNASSNNDTCLKDT